MESIRTLDLPQLQAWMEQHGFPRYRARQLYEWLWRREAGSFEEMRNLPSALRERLASCFRIEKLEIADAQKSRDGSVKYALRLPDGLLVEMVLIPSPHRVTLCLSSQVGCALHCRFCATANLGFKRNLTAYEIYAQAQLADRLSKEQFGMPLSNIVCMGMGEPLLNYDQVVRAIRMITASDGMGMSPSRITLSTSGIADGIRRLADEGLSIHLALSLHSADDAQRRWLMPVAAKYPLQELSDALAYYHEQTHERITMEYMLLHEVNDTSRHVSQLLQFCKRFPVKINIIHYNEHPYAPFRASTPAVSDLFVNLLTSKNLVVNVRQSKGGDIAAACGQLANQLSKKN